MVSFYSDVRLPVQQMREEMDRLLSGFARGMGDGWLVPRGRPAINVWESDDSLIVEAEVPGVKGGQLDISVMGNELTLRTERPELAQEGVTYHRQERPTGTFVRSVPLPASIDAGRVLAELRDGVLTLTLPKAEAAKPRKINVASGG